MSNKFNKNNVVSSLFWNMLERGGTQGVQLVVQIILARLLSPDAFGTIAIVLVFVNLAQVLVTRGFNTAIIQKKEIDNEELSSVFYLNLLISVCLYLLMFFSAPLVANFYSNPELAPLLRVLSLNLFPGTINSIQIAIVSRNLMFKKMFKSSLGATVISGLAGTISAYYGLGVWALVIQQLTNQSSVSLIMWFTVKWRPIAFFSISKVRDLFSFGWKMLSSSLIDILYQDLRTLIIGRIYSPSMLGLYNRGQRIPKTIVNGINGSIQSVMLPTLSAYQDNKNRMKSMMRRSVQVGSFFIFPMMIGLVVIAESLVVVVLTEEWLPSVIFLRIFTLYYALIPIHMINLQAISAMGRSDLRLKLEIFKKTFGVIILLISIKYGVTAIAIGQLIHGFLSSIVNTFPNKYLLNYSYMEQIVDLLPALINSLIMGCLVYLLNYLDLNVRILLITQILLGIVIYIILSKLSRNDSYKYIIDTIREMTKKKKTIVN